MGAPDTVDDHYLLVLGKVGPFSLNERLEEWGVTDDPV